MVRDLVNAKINEKKYEGLLNPDELIDLVKKYKSDLLSDSLYNSGMNLNHLNFCANSTPSLSKNDNTMIPVNSNCNYYCNQDLNYPGLNNEQPMNTGNSEDCMNDSNAIDDKHMEIDKSELAYTNNAYTSSVYNISNNFDNSQNNLINSNAQEKHENCTNNSMIGINSLIFNNMNVKNDTNNCNNNEFQHSFPFEQTNAAATNEVKEGKIEETQADLNDIKMNLDQ